MGLRSAPWHSRYIEIRYRCRHEPRYGGRGIKCNIKESEIRELWLRDHADKMKYPTIHRKDNDGNYTKRNCQFIERSLNIKHGHACKNLLKKQIKKQKAVQTFLAEVRYPVWLGRKAIKWRYFKGRIFQRANFIYFEDKRKNLFDTRVSLKRLRGRSRAESPGSD